MTEVTNVYFAMGAMSHAARAQIAVKAAELALPVFEKAHPDDRRIFSAVDAAKAHLADEKTWDIFDLAHADGQARAAINEIASKMEDLKVNHAMYSAVNACAYIAADNKDEFMDAGLDAVRFAIEADPSIEQQLVAYINDNQAELA
tara:strand:+ start:10892 stop:11329 length:438 start_codon:yes stop_codon:yes gene_type:complete